MVMDDAAWLAEPPKRSRLRLVLAVALLAALVFFGGVQVQKRYGVAGSATSPTATGGFPSGFTPGGGGFPQRGGGQSSTGQSSTGQSSTGQSSTGQSSTGAGSGSTTTDSAAVIGTLVSVEDGVWTVKDLGGKTHQITVGDEVKIVRETTLTADQVAAGATVDISGTTDDQGQVTATTITVR
jgi:hypothetical protein